MRAHLLIYLIARPLSEQIIVNVRENTHIDLPLAAVKTHNTYSRYNKPQKIPHVNTKSIGTRDLIRISLRDLSRSVFTLGIVIYGRKVGAYRSIVALDGAQLACDLSSAHTHELVELIISLIKSLLSIDQHLIKGLELLFDGA